LTAYVLGDIFLHVELLTSEDFAGWFGTLDERTRVRAACLTHFGIEIVGAGAPYRPAA